MIIINKFGIEVAFTHPLVLWIQSRYYCNLLEHHHQHHLLLALQCVQEMHLKELHIPIIHFSIPAIYLPPLPPHSLSLSMQCLRPFYCGTEKTIVEKVFGYWCAWVFYIEFNGKNLATAVWTWIVLMTRRTCC